MPRTSATGVTETDIENTRRFLHDTPTDALGEWAEERTEVHYIGAITRPYRMVIDRRSSTDAVVVTGEFANGITPHAVARARVVRDMVMPDASLLLQPNAGAGQVDNMNFSRSERATLGRGLLLPLHNRLQKSVKSMGEPERLTIYGPSQGGAVALDYAATIDAPAVAILEAPNILERSRVEMTRAFLGCGDLLKEVIKENYGDDMTNAPVISIKGLARFVISASHPDNLAMVGVLRTGDARQRMQQILDHNGSVVHAYARGDAVSPVEINDEIADSLKENERYHPALIEGDHSISNNFAIGAHWPELHISYCKR